MAPERESESGSRAAEKPPSPGSSSLAGLHRAVRSMQKRCPGKGMSRKAGMGCKIFPRRKRGHQPAKAGTAPTSPMGTLPKGNCYVAQRVGPLPPRLQLLRMFKAVLFVTRLQRLQRESLRERSLRAIAGSPEPGKHPKLSLPLCDSRGTTPCSTPAAATRGLGSTEMGGFSASASPESPAWKHRPRSPSKSRLSWSLSPVSMFSRFQRCGSGTSENTPERANSTPKAGTNSAQISTSSSKGGDKRSSTGTKSWSGSRRLAQVGLAVVQKLSSASSSPSKRPSVSSAGSSRPGDRDTDQFTGQWTCTGTWGLEEFLKKLGTPYMQRRLALSAPWPTWEFVQTGNHFYFKNKTVMGEIIEEFIVDGPEYTMRDGRKQQLTCKAYWEGSSLIIQRQGPQGPFQEERKISGDGLLMQFVLRSLDGSGTSWGRNFKRSWC